MPTADELFNNWDGVIGIDDINNQFFDKICQSFELPHDEDNRIEDKYVYRVEDFGMTLRDIKFLVSSGAYVYKYRVHGHQIDIPSADITAYTTIFSPTTDTSKALKAFSSNAKKSSPRETVSKYLESRRICPFKIPKSKTHVNPYLDFWAHSCQMTAFLGPLPDPSYSDPANAPTPNPTQPSLIMAKRTHPVLPVFYHHFGCVVPTYDALYIISQLAAESGSAVIDMASGNGYWTYMLRRMKLDVVAVDSMASEYRTMWISDTVKSDGVEYLKKNGGVKGKILLMVYMITAGTLTKRVVQAYRGDTIVVVGTQNANRFTGFSDCTAEEWFEKEMPGWELTCRIAMPSFAGKDEALFVWKKK